MAQCDWVEREFSSFILFGFYSVIGGWIIIYMGNVIWQILSLNTTHLTQLNFEAMISNPWLTVLGQGIFIFLTMIIVMLGVEKGLEKASKIMMPLLFIFLIIVVVKSLSLDGSLEGVRYLLQPRVEDISMEGFICVRSIILYLIIRNNWNDYIRKLCTEDNDY